MRNSVRLAAFALILAVLPAGASARAPKHREVEDDRPVTRAEVATALEPVFRARLTRNGRQVTGQDITDIEDSAIHVTDEMASAQTRVAQLTREIEELRREIRDLSHRRRRSW